MACAGCRQTRDELKTALARGNIAAATKAAIKGARQLAAQVKRSTPPAITRNLRRR